MNLSHFQFHIEGTGHRIALGMRLVYFNMVAFPANFYKSIGFIHSETVFVELNL